jgi:hypothetical protein
MVQIPVLTQTEQLFLQVNLDICTVKAPKIRQGFHEKYFFTPYFCQVVPFDRACKIKVFVVPKLNFYSEIHRDVKKDFSRVSKLPSGLLTSTHTNNS